MKRPRQITIDEEIDEELSKLPNASNLINELLRDNFYKSGKLKKQELILKLGQKQTQIEVLKDEIANIKELIKQAEVKEQKLKSIPEEIIQDFTAFPKMDKTILRKRYIEIYKSKYDLEWGELLKAWEEWKSK